MLLHPLLVHRDTRRLNLSLGFDNAIPGESSICLLENIGQLFKGIGDDEPSFPHCTVLCISSLQMAVRHTAGVAKLHLSCEHLGASSDSPGNDRFANDALLDGLDDAVLLDTPDLSKQDEHLAVEIFLITEVMVDESQARVTITTNSNTLAGAIGDEKENVVEFVGHASRLGNVSDRAWVVEF